jgi:hypothetical protein
MHSPVVTTERRSSPSTARAIVAGFIALGVSTVTLVIVSGIAGAIGEAFRDSGLLFTWMYELTHDNPVVELGRGRVFTSLAIHLAFGMFWAVLYALVFEPRLRHYPGWLAGVLFSMLPFALSVVLFPLIVGAGWFWSDLGAGPLPVLGNLILHLIYGATLGAGYSAGLDRSETPGDTEVEDLGQTAAMGRAETSAARGILLGAFGGGVLGAILGGVLPFSSGEQLVGSWPVALGVAGALAGGAMGALVGSMIGLTSPSEELIAAPPTAGQPISAAMLPLAVVPVVGAIIVSIGSLLLTVAGSVQEAHETHRYYYLNPILVGLAILTVIVSGAAALDKWLPRHEEHQH